jgi:hypothetical protein
MSIALYKPRILLDVDQTLIGYDKNRNPHLRPFIIEFLLFCFDNFLSVGLWSAAEPAWFYSIIEKILDPLLEGLNNTHHKKWRFYPILDQTYCTIIVDGPTPALYKDLMRLYRAFPDHSPSGTLLIDDNLLTFGANRSNTVVVFPFNLQLYDSELYYLVAFLTRILELFDMDPDVRKIDKEDWQRKYIQLVCLKSLIVK